ncbi:MAG: phage Gp37/Gp68 family protein [bacterium]|nr:phage Gp37/Gp68 family protein [bacterium]
MGINSSIEWTHHTFNPWWGCVKVSQACKHCYAEAWARRTGHDVWGSGNRRFFGERHWSEPLRWDAQASKAGTRSRVFCASMADVFEDRSDLDPWRERLWALIDETSNLDWLLLTKRPENISQMAPWDRSWPANVWVGTTVENQKEAQTRLPHLSDCAAIVRFLSCEPLLGALDLSNWIDSIEWIIAGGESGPKARPGDPRWFRDLRDMAIDSRIPFHFKQWGAWAPRTLDSSSHQTWVSSSGEVLLRQGKKAAGRLLDGQTWDQFPSP